MTKRLYELPAPKNGLIGHRGAAGHAPENTLISIEQAARLGLDWVEFDIRLCSSGEWIVFHDSTLERTTNGRGNIFDTPYSMLQALDAGAWFNLKFQNTRIPTLIQVLSLLESLSIHPNIEIKPFEKNQNKLNALKNFLQVLDNYWPNHKLLPLVSSFDEEILIILRNLHPTLPLGYLTRDFTLNVLENVVKRQFNTLNCYHDQVFTSDMLKQAELQGIPVLVYTINEPKRIEFLLSMGVWGIFSDMTHKISLEEN